MTLLGHGFIYEFIPNLLSFAGLGCVVLIGGGIAYFVVRDTFRYGRNGIPFGWAVVIIALFTGFGFWALRYGGLLVAPILGAAYALGRRQARRDEAARESRDGTSVE
jgi:hypothetical protein